MYRRGSTINRQIWMHACLLLFAVYVHCVHASDDAKTLSFLGCFRDQRDQRALPNGFNSEPDMTVGRCLALCSKHGFHYAGLQYKTECYCGKRAPKYQELTAKECFQPCGGDPNEICGGNLALSVYYIESPESRENRQDNRPLIALTMIVKNEAHTLKDTFASIESIVDAWYILDTGSTDGTQELIEAFWRDKNIPGKLFHEPFVDYGTSRNRILELAAEQTPKPVFTLTLSADERVINPEQLREAMEDREFSFGPRHGAYFVQMDSGVVFDSIRLARVDAKWRYVGRVHEYLADEHGVVVNVEKPEPFIKVKFRATDGERRQKSHYKNREFLMMDYAEDPTNTRTLIYLARTNALVGNFTESFKFYQKLALISRWNEEQYHARVMAADTHKKIKPKDFNARQSILLEAFEALPSNIDALYFLAQEHYDSGRYQLAYLFALHAVDIPEPSNRKQVQSQMLRDVGYLYEYEAHRLLAFAAEKLHKWELCVREISKVLKVRPDDAMGKKLLKGCNSKMPLGWETSTDVDAREPPTVVFEIVEKECSFDVVMNFVKRLGLRALGAVALFLLVVVIGLSSMLYCPHPTQRCLTHLNVCKHCRKRFYNNNKHHSHRV